MLYGPNSRLLKLYADLTIEPFPALGPTHSWQSLTSFGNGLEQYSQLWGR